MTYSNGFVYENGSLSYILTSVGRYVMNGSSGKYEYNICDHLGNVRAVVDDSGELLQQNDYYPFGGLMSSFGGSDNKYLYNGKKLQEGTDWLDYGARMYDGYLGRWYVIDNKAETYYNKTPYMYAMNNPIRFIDPDGNDGWDVVKGFTAALADNIFGGMTNTKSFLVIDGLYMQEDREIYKNFIFKSNTELKITTENWIIKEKKSLIHSNSYKINPDTGEIVEILK